MSDEDSSDKREREQRAARLRGKIESIKKGNCTPASEAANPREFLNQKMRERHEQENEQKEKEGV